MEIKITLPEFLVKAYELASKTIDRFYKKEKITCHFCKRVLDKFNFFAIVPLPNGTVDFVCKCCLYKHCFEPDETVAYCIKFLEEMETKIEEFKEIKVFSINKNILIYYDDLSRKIFLKVTDYQKGYWAESPLTPKDLLRLSIFLENIKSEEWK